MMLLLRLRQLLLIRDKNYILLFCIMNIHNFVDVGALNPIMRPFLRPDYYISGVNASILLGSR